MDRRFWREHKAVVHESWMTKFLSMVPNICVSLVWKLPRGHHSGAYSFEEFWKICIPLAQLMGR